MAEEKKLDMETVIEMAKDTLRKSKSISPEVIMESTKNGKTERVMALFVMDGPDGKEKAKEALRALVSLHQSDRYFLFMEVWMSSVDMENMDHPYLMPSKSKNRQEALLISEYRRDLTTKLVTIPFERKRNTIIFKKPISTDQSNSTWNAYLELEGINERMDKFRSEMHDKYLRHLSKKMADKYKAEFVNSKSVEEAREILGRLIEDAKKYTDEQVKKHRSDN